MAMVYRCVGILTVDVVFFRSPSVFHSQDSFPSTFRPRPCETFSSSAVGDIFRSGRCRCVRCSGSQNPDCRCRLLPKSRRLPFSGFLPPDVSSPAVGDIFRSGRCRCVRCSGSQVVRELKIDHTQRHLPASRNSKHVIMQWVGIGTHTLIKTIMSWKPR